ncbi:MAG: hypothetical protein M3394_01375 [Actinomycetota bacterium]|nr:hypothetical protein [Actinomycetota bacterium]
MEPEVQRTVHLSGVPPTLYMRLHLHLDDLLRELALLGMSHEYGLAPCWDPAREQVLAAERAGQDLVDIELCLPTDAAERLSRLLEQSDSLCRAGLLLGVETPPDVRQFRDWLVEELARQLKGGSAS